MARSYHIIREAVFAVASLSLAGAQATRPVFPPPRPQPTRPAQQNPQQPSPTVVPQNQQTAPIKPSPIAVPTPPSQPTTPPTVSYRDGLLTVQATNSTLGSVLNAIRNKTGIEFEGMENASDHVALSLGPAPAGEVLTALLQGSKFGFVAIARPDDPSIVQRVILTPKTQPGAVAGAQAQPQPRPNDNGEGGGDEDNPDEQVNVEPQDTAAQPPQVQQPQPQPEPQQPKTEQQLFQELQEMKKQQQMQQEGAPPPNPANVPRKPPR